MNFTGKYNNYRYRKKFWKQKSDPKKTEPYWYQKKYMKVLSRFRPNLLRVLLNKDIIIFSEKMRNRKLEKKLELLNKNSLSKEKIEKEENWKYELEYFFNELKTICEKISPYLNIYIFGGIINKIINNNFDLENYDIDMYLSFSNTSNVNIPNNVLLSFLNEMTKNSIITHIKDMEEIRGSMGSNNSYRYMLNRPGISGLKHIKGKRYFKNIGYIDIDIISGEPNLIGVDCNISNLKYNLKFKTLSYLKNTKDSILKTLVDIRHKSCNLYYPTFQGRQNLEQVFLLQGRQKKYLLQDWNIRNKFTFPQVSDDWECAVCYDATKDTISSDSIVTFKCNHSFCKKCLVTMLNSVTCPSKDKCPYCRKNIEIKLEIDETRSDLRVFSDTDFHKLVLTSESEVLNSSSESDEELDDI